MTLSTAKLPDTDRHLAQEQGSCPTAKQLFGVLAGYFIFQILVRVWISPSADLDEAGQVVLAQKWSWGYGPQPPLYTWLQIPLFKAFGLSIFSLALLKNILLLGIYVFAYLNARLITRCHICGVTAAALLLLIPEISWESQRDLTHSVLASFLALATLYSFLRLRKTGNEMHFASARAFALFGMCAGLGVLSKYNYAVFLAGLIGAAISVREFRAIVFNSKMILALLVALLVLSPHVCWILNHRDLAFSSAKKFHIQQTMGWPRAVTTGITDVLVSSLTFLSLLAVVCVAAFWRSLRELWHRPKTAHEIFLLRMLLVPFALLFVAILVLRVTNIRERWLLPILVSSSVLVAVVLQPYLNRARLKVLLVSAGVVMLMIAIAIPGRILLADRMRRTFPLNKPYDAIARQMQEILPRDCAVVTDNEIFAGNLRLRLPEKLFFPPEFAGMFRTKASLAYVWDATPQPQKKKRATDADALLPSPDLVDFAHANGVTNLEPTQILSATFKYHRNRQMRVCVFIPKP